MKTKETIKNKIVSLEERVKKDKSFLRSNYELSIIEWEYIEEDIYIMQKEINMLKWVLA